MDINKISSLCLDISTEWRDIQIIYINKKGKEKTIDIPLVITGSNGIYVFLNSTYKEDAKYIYQYLQKIFLLRGDGLYLFFGSEDDEELNEEVSEEKAFAYDFYDNKLIEINDLYEAFDVFYYNHYIPQADLIYYNFSLFEDYFVLQDIKDENKDQNLEKEEKKYVRPIVNSEKLEKIEKKIEELLSSGKKIGNYTYYQDGSVTVKKIVSNKSPFSSYMEQRTYDYPCSEEDGDKTFLITALGGWFGLHKFRTYKILQGILYLISCGGFCLFYIFDLISVITGNYSTTNRHYFRELSGNIGKTETKIFNRPIKNKKLLFIIPITVALAIVLLRFAYFPIYKNIGNAFSNIGRNATEKQLLKDNEDKLSNLSLEELEKYIEEHSEEIINSADK